MPPNDPPPPRLFRLSEVTNRLRDVLLPVIANSPLPVWVGIGHEIDVGVLDHVAHSSHKTPTAVAEALVAQLREVDARLASAIDRLVVATNRVTDLKTASLGVCENGLRQGVRKHLQIQEARFGRWVSRLETLLAEHAERRARQFQAAVTMLQQRARALMDQHAARLTTIANGLDNGARRRLAASAEQLARSRTGLSEGTRKQLSAAAGRLARRPQTFQAIVERRTVRLSESLMARSSRLRASMRSRTDSAAQRLGWLSGRLTLDAYLRRHEQAVQRLDDRRRLLAASSPERLLERGYTITRTASGRIVRSIRDISAGDVIRIQLADGTATSEVNKIEEGTDG